MLGDLAIAHPIHVDVLNLEGATRGLNTNEHSAIDRKARRTSVGSAVGASDHDPLALRDTIQRCQLRVWEVGLNFSQHCPHASTPYLSAMILAVVGEAACRRVEVATIERLIELFGDEPIGLRSVQGKSPVAAWDSADSTSHTNPNAATSGYTIGIEFQSIGEDRPGRLLLCRTYSNRVHKCRTSGHPCGASSRTADSGCAAAPKRRVSSLLQAREVVTRYATLFAVLPDWLASIFLANVASSRSIFRSSNRGMLILTFECSLEGEGRGIVAVLSVQVAALHGWDKG